jgi:hypothetical protein
MIFSPTLANTSVPLPIPCDSLAGTAGFICPKSGILVQQKNTAILMIQNIRSNIDLYICLYFLEELFRVYFLYRLAHLPSSNMKRAEISKHIQTS